MKTREKEIQNIILEERIRILQEMGLDENFLRYRAEIFKRLEEIHPEILEKYRSKNDELKSTSNEINDLKKADGSTRAMDETLERTLDKPNDITDKKLHYDLIKTANDVATINEELNKRLVDRLETSGKLSKEELEAFRQNQKVELAQDIKVKKSLEDINTELDKQAKIVKEISKDIGQDTPNLVKHKGVFKEIVDVSSENLTNKPNINNERIKSDCQIDKNTKIKTKSDNEFSLIANKMAQDMENFLKNERSAIDNFAQKNNVHQELGDLSANIMKQQEQVNYALSKAYEDINTLKEADASKQNIINSIDIHANKTNYSVSRSDFNKTADKTLKHKKVEEQDKLQNSVQITSAYRRKDALPKPKVQNKQQGRIRKLGDN